ncbi:MAG: hypothetical protein ABIV47_13270 [Roseiflexaceae bacterium]
MHASLPRILAGFMITSALLVGCATTPAAQSPTTLPAPAATSAPVATIAASAPTQAATPDTTSAPTDDQIKAGIQQTLDRYAQAYNDNQPDMLKQVVDQSNLPFRRLIQGRFDTYQNSIFAGQVTSEYKVDSIKPRDLGFVQAQVMRTSDGAVADWLFRQVQGKWLLSEPTEDQIGKRLKIETDHFTYYTYPWATDITPKLEQLMESARAKVLERLGKVPDTKTNVYILPIFGVGSPQNSGVLAYYDAAARGGARIVIFAPESFSFSFYDPSQGWEPALQGTLTHEYTHLVNNTVFTPIARMADWMFEGLAEYVSDHPRAGEVRDAVQSDNIIPIIDTSGKFNKQDLEHLTILNQDVSLAYGLAYSLVAYVNEKYGGMDGYWKLVRAFDKQQNLDKALQEAFGVSYKQFDKDWRAWLKQKYS